MVLDLLSTTFLLDGVAHDSPLSIRVLDQNYGFYRVGFLAKRRMKVDILSGLKAGDS
jgi:hypothetical protein